ncbi:MAG: DUF2235 domain-containing protein [Pseudonocardiaceae bacterium]
MRHLVMCCDGTWNTPEQPAATNVARLHNALADTAEDGTEQLRYYHSGVGTEGGLLNWLAGGAAGIGLSRNVQSAYQWLTTTYEPGDRVSLFGFSRGAYTVRSLAGMIGACGLIDCRGLDEATTWRRVRQVHERRYRPGRKADPRWRDDLTFRYDPNDAERIPVHFIGVWDTVGAFGVPDSLGLLNLLDPPRRHAFHDVALNPHIRHARHALAMDEFRSPFTPTLWSDWAPGQDVRQTWFPGSHLDVGGYYPQHGLADGPLLWMIEQARDAAGLAFRKTMVDQIRPDPLDLIHNDNRDVLGALALLYEPLLEPLLEPLFESRPRAVPLIDPRAPSPSVDRSAYERHQNPPIGHAPYRPTRVLARGQSATVSVSAREPWDETGLYLEAGDYSFAATGEWLDARIPSGPAGTTGLQPFRPWEAGRLVGTAIGLGEQLFRRLSRNPRVNFLFSRREEDMPWMSLVGVVANDAVPVKGALTAHQRIRIGSGTRDRVSKPGYLYAFANDAWGFYSNNRGSVSLTVTRTA